MLAELVVRALPSAKRILIAGCGGGYDVLGAVPLVHELRARGLEAHLASLSFCYLNGLDRAVQDPEIPTMYAVRADAATARAYCPEAWLARFLDSEYGTPHTIWSFDKVGVQPLEAAYRALVARLGIDAIVLVDGGTDILMRGDEAGLGTPHEDMVSLAAVDALRVPTRIVACIGFGIDTFHGVCHAHFLENVAALARGGAYLGAFSVAADSDEGAAFLDAVKAAQAATPGRPSIVNGSIAAAVAGEFGDVQFTARTSGSELFINPLMSMYFAFDLPAVAARSLYLPALEKTTSIFDVAAIIEAFRRRATIRPRRVIPH